MLPRYFGEKGLKRCTFKYGLDEDFRRVINTLKTLGLDSTEKIKVGSVEVSPRDVVAAAAPNPAEIGHLMEGAVSAGIWINGVKGGKERNVYMYQLADNRDCMNTVGSQVVVAQTAFNPVIMMELLAKGIWKGSGVKGPEWFDPEPFMERMARYGFKPGMMEMESAYKRAMDEQELKRGYS
jgi:saccharopine dehydrogenase-like NADP-dependent oxidoreductase